jgi:hypothetical protein
MNYTKCELPLLYSLSPYLLNLRPEWSAPFLSLHPQPVMMSAIWARATLNGRTLTAAAPHQRLFIFVAFFFLQNAEASHFWKEQHYSASLSLFKRSNRTTWSCSHTLFRQLQMKLLSVVLNFGILTSYVTDVMRYFADSLPGSKLEIWSRDLILHYCLLASLCVTDMWGYADPVIGLSLKPSNFKILQFVDLSYFKDEINFVQNNHLHASCDLSFIWNDRR